MNPDERKTIKLCVGLGNPGPRYAETRHNAGFFVLNELARRDGASWRSTPIGEQASALGLTLLKPNTFMNRSGGAVQSLITRTRRHPHELLVVQDDLDLPLGRLRLKRGGGAGGQRGVRDIIESIGPDFDRLKIGIGRPPEGWTSEHWVLSRFSAEERELLNKSVAHAADAIERLLAEGFERSCSWTNALRLDSAAEATASEGTAAADLEAT